MTLQEQWREFRHVVIPPNASTYQIIEMRRAFYAGAAASIHIVCSANKPVEAMKELGNEFMQFRNDVLDEIK